MRPHLTHLSVQCSKPGRAAVIRWTSMRDWHLRQRGRAAARCDRVGVCRSGNRYLPWNAAGALPNSRSPTKCHWRSGDGAVCAAPGAGCRSILLSLRKLKGRHASACFRLESKRPRTGPASAQDRVGTDQYRTTTMMAMTMMAAISESARSNVFERVPAEGTSSGGMT
jgi:hypothetical protein